MFSYGNYGILRDMLRDIDCGVALRFKMLLKVMKKQNISFASCGCEA